MAFPRSNEKRFSSKSTFIIVAYQYILYSWSIYSLQKFWLNLLLPDSDEYIVRLLLTVVMQFENNPNSIT